MSMPPRTPSNLAPLSGPPGGKLLGTSASLPALGKMLGPHDRMTEIAQEFSEMKPKTRQRIFAAHTHDMQLLQQMVSVLTARAARTQGRDRGIAQAGLIEEGQLYAVCMQQLATQVAVHSPALSQLAGELFHGFVGLYKRTIDAQEGRLARER